MGRQSEDWKPVRSALSAQAAIPFIHRLTASRAFRDLFREGMALVEEAAAYLDGPGRVESRTLGRPAALAYATESMRLTTRLMQVAAWLLLRRAVNEGELTPAQALAERHRVKLTPQVSSDELFDLLPPTLRKLSRRSLRIQERVIHLDRCLTLAGSSGSADWPCEVASQRERLRLAFTERANRL